MIQLEGRSPEAQNYEDYCTSHGWGLPHYSISTSLIIIVIIIGWDK
jgi:hypothetical protein